MAEQWVQTSVAIDVTLSDGVIGFIWFASKEELRQAREQWKRITFGEPGGSVGFGGNCGLHLTAQLVRDLDTEGVSEFGTRALEERIETGRLCLGFGEARGFDAPSRDGLERLPQASVDARDIVAGGFKKALRVAVVTVTTILQNPTLARVNLDNHALHP